MINFNLLKKLHLKFQNSHKQLFWGLSVGTFRKGLVEKKNLNYRSSFLKILLPWGSMLRKILIVCFLNLKFQNAENDFCGDWYREYFENSGWKRIITVRGVAFWKFHSHGFHMHVNENEKRYYNSKISKFEKRKIIVQRYDGCLLFHTKFSVNSLDGFWESEFRDGREARWWMTIEDGHPCHGIGSADRQLQLKQKSHVICYKCTEWH